MRKYYFTEKFDQMWSIMGEKTNSLAAIFLLMVALA